jgi:UDP-N-acetylmuramoyl-tripeptide--D-alanyl-D-alanine ligase
MAALSLQTVAEATGGIVLSGDPGLTVDKYAIDSRHVDGGELFFALVGDRNNGHDYLADVFQRGAAAAVVSDPADVPGPTVQVDDTTTALRSLARSVRLDWGGRVIGITGSCGKTTTKEMLRTILAASQPVLATRGNYNNLYGLPLMLLELLPEHQVAVLEMGISTPGEMAPLAAIACPDVAVLLNVDAVHLVHFSSVDEILNTKAAILDALRPGGTFVYNADDVRVSALARRRGGTAVSFGLEPGADVTAGNISQRADGTLCATLAAGCESATLILPVAGRHNLMNALAALAAAQVVGVPLAAGAAALAGFAPPPMRGQRTDLAGGVSVWDESYNSNPASLRAVLATVAGATTDGRRVLVCGDMLELGPEEKAAHLALAPDIVAAGIDLFIAVGPLSAELADALERDHHLAVAVCADADEAGQRAVELVAAGDLVVVKGSRSMRTDKVVAALVAARPEAGA